MASAGTEQRKLAAILFTDMVGSMQFKHPTNSAPEIARQLKVEAVIRGTLKREGDRVKIEVGQFNGRSDRQLWSTKFERDVRDAFDLQNEIALAIARKMKVKVTSEEQARLTRPCPVAPEALDLYYRGKAVESASRGTNSARQERIRLYENAVKMDKNFAPAWAALAGAYIDLLYWQKPEDSKELEGLAEKALMGGPASK